MSKELKVSLAEFLEYDAFMCAEDYPDWKNWHNLNAECPNWAEMIGFYDTFNDDQKRVLQKGANYNTWEVRRGNSELSPVELTRLMDSTMSAIAMQELLNAMIAQYESNRSNQI